MSGGENAEILSIELKRLHNAVAHLERSNAELQLALEEDEGSDFFLFWSPPLLLTLALRLRQDTVAVGAAAETRRLQLLDQTHPVEGDGSGRLDHASVPFPSVPELVRDQRQ